MSLINTKAKDKFYDKTELGVAQYMWKKYFKTRCLKYPICLQDIKICQYLLNYLAIIFNQDLDCGFFMDKSQS